MKTASIFSGHHDSFSTILNATEVSVRSLNVNNIKDIDIEILSTETIKPASPTPHHLRTFNLSLIDQIVFDGYVPLIVFLPNTDKASLSDVMTKRSKHLKETLSGVLTRFYVLAGKVKDNLHIECNDEGVYYVETRVNQTLEEFLSHQDDETIRPLMPERPHTRETSIGNFIMGVQVNIFNCGGIGLSTSTSHKIIDFHAYMIFMKAWAAAIRGSPETSISPNYMASDVFPNDPLIGCSVPSKLMAAKVLSTKRFVFSSTALAVLKSQPMIPGTSRGPTRMEATAALIWKAAANAASKVRAFSPQSPHAMLSVVNLRKRASPSFPDNSFGNIISVACAMCFPNSKLESPNLMGELRESITKVDTDLIESVKGEKGSKTMTGIITQLNHLADVTEVGDCILSSSVLNMGIYDLDFGWGKPIWFYYMQFGFARFLALIDTPKGGGIEAMVTLSPEEMNIFEQDPELLSYAIVNPNPLQSL